MNHFFLCDSPTLESGFARVSQNLLPRFDVPKKHVWALGYNGEAHSFDANLYPANVNYSWEHPDRVDAFFQWLFSFRGESTLWVLHDPFRLRKFSEGFRIFKEQGGKIISYIPVDSPLEPEDEEYLRYVDIAVAYTEFGASEIRKIMPEKQVFVIPHGYDPDFQPVEGMKEKFFPDLEDKCLIGVVNSNDTRKALHRSIETLQKLREKSDNYVMYMHCDPNGYYRIKELARSLGVLDSIIFADPFFGEGARIGQSTANKEVMIALYNSFDIFLSTSYGEGWGLTASEAATCGTPICIPDHTAFPNIYRRESALWIPADKTAYYNGKIVPDIDPQDAANVIDDYVNEEFFLNHKRIAAKADVERFSWDDMGNLWNQCFEQL